MKGKTINRTGGGQSRTTSRQVEAVRDRIDSFREHRRRFCLSDAAMRRRLLRATPGIRFERARIRTGQFVTSQLYGGRFVIVGHGFTGARGEQRGAYGCRLGSRGIYKRWQWLGPESALRLC